MYKTTLRQLTRYSVRRLNEGDDPLLKRLEHSDIQFSFPGDNWWSTMFRSPERGRDPFSAHRGFDEVEVLAERFAALGLQCEIEDILVNDPPSNTRAAIRVREHLPSADGNGDEYNNRSVMLLNVRQGRLARWEDYLDTERFALWDSHNFTAKDGHSDEIGSAPAAAATS